MEGAHDGRQTNPIHDQTPPDELAGRLRDGGGSDEGNWKLWMAMVRKRRGEGVVEWTLGSSGREPGGDERRRSLCGRADGGFSCFGVLGGKMGGWSMSRLPTAGYTVALGLRAEQDDSSAFHVRTAWRAVDRVQIKSVDRVQIKSLDQVQIKSLRRDLVTSIIARSPAPPETAAGVCRPVTTLARGRGRVSRARERRAEERGSQREQSATAIRCDVRTRPMADVRIPKRLIRLDETWMISVVGMEDRRGNAAIISWSRGTSGRVEMVGGKKSRDGQDGAVDGPPPEKPDVVGCSTGTASDGPRMLLRLVPA